MGRPAKYPPDPAGYKRERPTTSARHQALNAAAGPGRQRNVLRIGRQQEQARQGYRAAFKAMMSMARRTGG